VCVHISRAQRERERERDRDRDRQRQTETETDTDTDMHLVHLFLELRIVFLVVFDFLLVNGLLLHLRLALLPRHGRQAIIVNCGVVLVVAVKKNSEKLVK
jgi:hypothetical protein